MTHTSATWDGVVMIERQDPTQTSHVAFETPMCLIRSARSGALGGMRAIVHREPFAAVQKYFRSQDEDHVFVRAELQGQHLELRERCTLSEWAGTAHVLPTSH
jgi:hypothetical protein